MKRIPIFLRAVGLLSIPTLIILLAATGCYQYHFFPVAVEDMEISPVYRLEIVNDTSHTLTFLPTDSYRDRLGPKKVVQEHHFILLVQVKRIKVGSTLTHEIVAGPYIDSGRLGPDMAYLQYLGQRDVVRDFVISLRNETWFDAYESHTLTSAAKPKVLEVRLTDENMNKPVWFRKGPAYP